MQVIRATVFPRGTKILFLLNIIPGITLPNGLSGVIKKNEQKPSTPRPPGIKKTGGKGWSKVPRYFGRIFKKKIRKFFEKNFSKNFQRICCEIFRQNKLAVGQIFCVFSWFRGGAGLTENSKSFWSPPVVTFCNIKQKIMWTGWTACFWSTQFFGRIPCICCKSILRWFEG